MAETSPIIALSEQIAALEASNAEMKESLDQAMLSLQLENRGWVRIGEGADGAVEGFTLEQLQSLSKSIRPLVAATGLIARGAWLHISYCWARGINIEGVASSGKRGSPTALQRFYKDRTNQESIFSDSAHAALQRTRFSDGMVLGLCDLRTDQVRIIPLAEITDIKVNPDFPSEIWAYQRTWTPNPGVGRPRVEWIYTKRYTGRKQETYTANGQTVDVRQGAVIVDLRANGQTGWVLGVPDCAPALPHYNSYIRAIAAGETVTESRAKLLMKITSKTVGGAANAAARVAGISGPGHGVSLAEGNDVSLIQGSERGYDFSSTDRLGSFVALSFNVPYAELMSDAQVGGNYASSASLTPATINAMRTMQLEWVSWYSEIFEVFGLKPAEIAFPPIQEPDAYRVMQERVLAWNTGLIHDDEMRPELLSLMQVASKHDGPPDGVMYPNNEYSEARTDIDPNGAAYSGPDSNNRTSTAPSPDQGRGNGAGGSDSGQRNDRRSDLVSEALKSMQIEEIRELVERFESVANRLG